MNYNSNVRMSYSLIINVTNRSVWTKIKCMYKCVDTQ